MSFHMINWMKKPWFKLEDINRDGSKLKTQKTPQILGVPNDLAHTRLAHMGLSKKSWGIPSRHHGCVTVLSRG